MHSMSKDWRNRNNINMFDPRRYNMESYYTSAQKKEMKHSFGDELLSNLHLLPDPLKKNLADSIITSESLALKSESKRIDKQFLNTVIEPEPSKMETGTNQSHIQAPFGGISNFLSGVFNVISGAMANWRPKSPAPYYDCFDDGATQGPPLSWHDSKNEVQNKSARENDLKSKSDMNIDCKTAVAQCEDKLNKVRLLLTTKAIETPKLRPRRPRKAFVEAGSIEERFEDAFAPEDFVNVSSDTCIEYYSSYKIHDEVLSETAAPKIKIEQIVHENTDIVKAMPENTVKCEESKQLDTAMVKDRTETKLDINSLVEDTIETKLDVKIDENEAGKTKEELVSSCEDKLSKLKALLQEKRKKNTHTMPSPNSNMEPVGKSNEIHSKTPKPHDKTKDKRYKNPCRTTNKRMKTRMRKSIQDDLVFAQELNVEDLSSAENSPTINRLSDNPLKKFADTNNCPNNLEYFDEVSGRFRSTSTTESEDSFQIVFNDSPKQNKMRCVSDCDSEDSFIVFEDSPDSCYTSNDVFGDSDESGSECTDSESDLSDTDDIQVTKLSHSLSRTLSDLTDGSLYEDNAFDEVDSAVRSVCDQISSQDIAECVPEVNVEPKSTGLLLNEEKKLLKRQQSPKSVHFSPHPPKVHVMRVWAFAARQARAGHWERCALDRDRFKRRIADVDMAVSWVLKPQHRSRVMFQRFMPWWNAQRRKEIADKKEREARIKEEQRIEAERLEMEKLEQESKVDNESSDVIVNDKEQEQINKSVNNDVTNNDSNYVIDKERKQINDDTVMENEKKINEIKSKELKNKEMKKFNEHKNNDLKVMIKGKLNGLKSNGCIRNKSQLNDVKTIVQANDNNDFTTKLRSEGLSST